MSNAPVMSDEVYEQLMSLRRLPNCPNMFDLPTVQRLAYEHSFFSLVLFIEENKQDYLNFILRGERE